MPTDHRFLINHEKWLWRYSRLNGSADGWTEFAKKKILINKDLKGQKLLECELHEGLHATLGPTISEESVTQASSDLARILWSLGYRRVEHDHGS